MSLEIVCENWTIPEEYIESVMKVKTFPSDKTLYQIYAGMGCQLFIKYVRENNDSIIYTFFMHSDAWGQYGEETNELPKLAAFIPDDYKNYFLVALDETLLFYIKNRFGNNVSANIKVIKCPICREISNINFTTHKPVRHHLSDDKQEPICCVCESNPVGIYLPECGHTVLCKNCAERISQS